MTGLLFSLFIISAYEVKVPDPYVGYGFNMFREKRNDPNYSFYRKFLTLGAPFKIVDNSTSTGVKERDRYVPTWIVVPELGYNTDITQINLSAGFESGMPFGYRTVLSSIAWGVQGGMHFNLFTLNGNYLNDDGSIMNSEDKTSIAFLVNTYVGPRFDISDRYALKLLLNPRVIFGRIAFHTYRSERTKWFGALIAFNLQLEFL